MRMLLFLSLSFLITNNYAQHDVNVTFKEDGKNIKILVDNNEVCPVSIKISFDVTNMKVSGGNNKMYLVDPLTKNKIVTELSPIREGRPYKFSFEYLTNYGDHKENNYDKKYLYYLPYEQGKTFRIMQGYNGSFSHQKQNALDFDMPEGTPITAVRDGIVVKVVDSHNKNCDQPSCVKFNNSILIHHNDGTFAEYAHLRQDGASVIKGEKINKGQIIGYSGNVGWSTTPHLHLVIFLQKLTKRKTLRTQFAIGDDNLPEFLKEGDKYYRANP